MKKILVLLAAIGAYGFATVATAQITFNVITDGSPQWPAASFAGLAAAPDPANGTNWNALIVGYGTSVPIVTNNIHDSLGVAFPGVSVTFSNTTAGGAQYTWNDASPSIPNPPDLMRTYTFFATYNVTVSGLAPGKYDFWYYGHGDQANQQGTVTINTNNGGGTFTSANSLLGRDITAGIGIAYTNFNGLTVGNDGVFRFQVANYLNAFQLRPSQPEGPAFLVTGTDACTDTGVTPGLSGSVTTNNYLLYRDGVDTGATPITGTGNPINFSLQTISGTYTIVATNPATTTSGLMYGKVRVYQAGFTIDTPPATLSMVSNLPASFTVQATGDSLTYQWLKNGVPVANGGTISGAQTPTLSISAVVPTNAGNYAVVVLNPCSGIGVTSSPPAVLTVTAPRNLNWVGGNPGSDWNYTDLNFSSGSATAFLAGDNVTFNDSSSFQSVTISNNLTPTMISVAGTKSYTFGGPKKLTGVSQLADSSSGILTITTDNDYSGGSTVGNGATLSLGDGSSSTSGSVVGIVTVASGGTLNYNYGGSANTTLAVKNALAGSGTVNYNAVNGAVVVTPNALSSSGFSGTINVLGFTALHGSASGGGNIFGDGSIVNLQQDGGQIWLDPQTTPYHNTFNIIGTGRPDATPTLGAIRIFNTTINGHINLMGDARIGGSIAGGTIVGSITGPYQLEILSTYSNTFVLNMGPTNGTHTYASTLLTSCLVKALNSGAISTGPLIIDSPSVFQLNGNNISVATLTAVNSGTVVVGPGAMVQNASATAPAVLSVGSDNSSFQYDGYMGDGGTQSLGLTKVGSGTLTLTTVLTNTGPVTVSGGTIAMSGSGSFTRAAILPAGSGIFDVSGAGGTLTLNSGQVVGGNGTVKGILVAPAGAKVAPGLPMGTLTVTGNGTVNGTYLANLNRTNSPSNCSKFTSSGGTITYSGATLAATNIGPKLQVGDFFQLFPGATAGFSTAQLPTIDVPNNAVYTWNNTVSSDGRITVATVADLVNTNSTNITASVNGGNLTLSWPADHTGWTLQIQTNTLGQGLGTNWVNMSGSTTTNQEIIPINSVNGSVFFRMKY